MKEQPNRDHVPHFGRVLVVEDEGPLRRVIARNLTNRRHPGVRGGYGERRRSRGNYRATDVPEQTGWDVLRELKRRGTDVPTIVVSAVRVSQSRLDEFHPLAYLPKPFPIDALLRLVLANRTNGLA